MRLRERCCCGAEFEGESVHATTRGRAEMQEEGRLVREKLEQFRRSHKACREAWAKAQGARTGL